MERIDGPTLTKLFQKKPHLLFKKTKELSEIHYNLNKIKAPEHLSDLKNEIRKIIDKSDFIDVECKEFVLDLLNQLPDGDRLCHGDFHPGNILIKNGDPYIIDWCAATKADPIADVAHTFLLFKNVPKIPGSSNISFNILKLAGLVHPIFILKHMKKNIRLILINFLNGY